MRTHPEAGAGLRGIKGDAQLPNAVVDTAGSKSGCVGAQAIACSTKRVERLLKTKYVSWASTSTRGRANIRAAG